ncbi:uncharacterized protein OCT59_022599 [Rhizophagus irregularis]|uniref:uncharacterized protein n=1 Tax=Rhizophagus irregularis TaxID=588596 RepID=UPI00332F03D8|nr:hypothetical protein OCT59_022599 [Rhizophagus irregularis]
MYATTHIQKREKLLLNNSRAIKQAWRKMVLVPDRPASSDLRCPLIGRRDGNSISANSRKKKSKSKDVKKNMEVTHIKQTSKKGEINIKIKISSK